MHVDPQSVYRAAAGYLEEMCAAFGDRATVETRGGAVIALSGLPAAFANGVWVMEPDADTSVIAAMLQRARAGGVPFLFVARDERRNEWADLAEEAGLTFAEDTPLMLLPNAAAVEVPASDVTYHLEGPDSFARHIELVADAFETSPEIFEDLMHTTRNLAGMHTYVGEVDGRAVTTAISMATPGPSVGIFSVATPTNYRGRGYGQAITAYAINQAARQGAQWAWLQSSEAGFPVYERMGFRTIGIQPMWVGD